MKGKIYPCELDPKACMLQCDDCFNHILRNEFNISDFGKLLEKLTYPRFICAGCNSQFFTLDDMQEHWREVAIQRESQSVLRNETRKQP